MKNSGVSRIKVTEYHSNSPTNFSSFSEVKQMLNERNRTGLTSRLSYMISFESGLLAPLTGFFHAPFKIEEVDTLQKKSEDLVAGLARGQGQDQSHEGGSSGKIAR